MDTNKVNLTHKLWGGRFSGNISDDLAKLNSSIDYDKRMWREDIWGSKAYAKGLEMCKIISTEERQEIDKGFNVITQEWNDDSFQIYDSDEDIHTANERRLMQIIGIETGGKLHTGRSRNDQVVTDMRLWLREKILYIQLILIEIERVIILRAENEIDILMPGYTHMQLAQPIRWSHWLMSYAFMFKRDSERLSELYHRVNQLPLGSGALAGHPFKIDREFLAKELKFDEVIENSIDATSDREFVLEFASWASITSMHLSRWAEDLIIYSTNEFGFITLDDAYSTGSSLMPQKKNPDSLELIRGKSGRIMGLFTGLMISLKALPLAYNKDLQESQEVMFDIYDSINGALKLVLGIFETIQVNRNKCLSSLKMSMLSTDLAYYLVRRKIPFRQAHEISGKCVLLAESKSCDLADLKLSDLTSIHDAFDEDVRELWDYENSVEQYQSIGGTSKNSIHAQITSLEEWINQFELCSNRKLELITI